MQKKKSPSPLCQSLPVMSMKKASIIYLMDFMSNSESLKNGLGKGINV